MSVEDDVDLSIAHERATSGCYCADFLKPCQYHEGVMDGAELAVERIKRMAQADVADWMAGA